MTYDTEQIHITLVRPGDTVVHDGQLRTVSACNLGKVDLLGRTLFGDSYHAGHRPVIRAFNLKG